MFPELTAFQRFSTLKMEFTIVGYFNRTFNQSFKRDIYEIDLNISFNETIWVGNICSLIINPYILFRQGSLFLRAKK